MLKRTVVLAAIVAGALARPGAAAFWDEKPYTAWTWEEMHRLVNDSPWSGPARVTRAAGSGPRGDYPEILVTWTTARPMREVLVRERLGTGGAVTKELEAFLATPADAYVVSLRISAPPGESYAADAKAALPHTVLDFDEWRSPLPAMAVEAASVESDAQPAAALGGVPASTRGVRAKATSLVVFTFPRGFGITTDHKEVQFKTRLGHLNITRKFKLKDMVYRGVLAL